eukprot:TRINITY_DN3187_c0_g1_i1.p1 TRINITY_DN3187_c0_g1~~TRINITY_DN3187_c0_g1_i1.p1  ORF type:complete len:479 (+),score=89.51 TRINITY_DN3187_c0_g1_i1:121-1557(+)
MDSGSSSSFSSDNNVKTIVQFVSRDDESTAGPPMDIPQDITQGQLELLLNSLLQNDEQLPYSFFVNDFEIITNLKKILEDNKISTENTLNIIYQPQAVFRVRPVTRCTGDLPGHSEAVLSVAFSPNGEILASGSGDTTVRIWDIETSTPKFTLKGHTNWVLSIAFSPNGKFLASGDMNGDVRVWNPFNGSLVVGPLKGHTKFITALAWEPLHNNPSSSLLASSSKDGTVKIWDIRTGRCHLTLSGHTMSVTCLRWGGSGFIYTGSQDRTIKMYEAKTGKIVRTLAGHGHWVNTLVLNTDYALRTGAWDYTGVEPSENLEEAADKARQRWEELKGKGGERLFSGSDDFTIYLWNPEVSNKPITRLTGHQQPINLLSFSPDGRLLASASFDKSLRLWDGTTGKFIATLRGHVGAVYQVCWSSDSRLLVSGSKDSTLKLWDVRTKKLAMDLPGHADEVYSVDWSPDGQRVVFCSKNRLIKI